MSDQPHRPPNQALIVGGGFTRTSWGFRKYPSGQWRLSDTISPPSAPPSAEFR
jgi:hypothetical protein